MELSRKTMLVASATFGVIFIAAASGSAYLGDVKGVVINGLIVLGFTSLFVALLRSKTV